MAWQSLQPAKCKKNLDACIDFKKLSSTATVTVIKGEQLKLVEHNRENKLCFKTNEHSQKVKQYLQEKWTLYVFPATV